MDINGHATDLAAGVGRVTPIAKTRLLRRNCELPPIPAVAVNLLGLLAQEEVSLGDVARAISADVTIAAEVLRAANTAYYGIRGEVTSISHATTLLGVSRIRALAATIGLRRYLGQALRLPAVQRCWRHNIATASTAEQIALRLGGSPADAYTAGLLHDIGRMALIVAHPKQYPAFLDAADVRGVELLELERNLLGMDHCEAGEWFAQQLLLPQVFQDVAGHHHNVDAVGPSDMLPRVAAACQLADWMGYWVTPLPGDADHDPAVLDRIAQRLPLAQRATLLGEVADLVADVGEQVRATEAMFES
ncbi:MAG: HDOD domain-containing protein [Vicinamibacterales bacterium]